MATQKPLYVVLCWHMHQPDYRDYDSGEFTLPWTYLHAIKDYTDMAAHLENEPKARAVFNYVPVLLDQLEDYDSGEFTLPWTYLHAIKDYTDMAAHLENEPKARAVFNYVPVLLDQLEDYADQFATGKIRDPLLRLLPCAEPSALSSHERALILDSCFRSNHANMIAPYPAYQRLRDIYQRMELERDSGNAAYLSGQYYADLLAWYHLTWTGETVRRAHPFVVDLMKKGAEFTLDERRALFRLIGELIGGLIPRYRALAAAGRVELSTTPYYHPIAPLLIDFESARESWPDVKLPQHPHYRGGLARAEFHLKSALSSHQRRFGMQAKGVWPAEGGVSTAAGMLFAQHGVRWTASGEAVLANSLKRARPNQEPHAREAYLYRPYRLRDGPREIYCFFRDDRLSDKIGFEYGKWFGKDAVANFIHELEQIRTTAPADETPVVSVILDGENAWEFYPYNGFYFLSELYAALAAHSFIRMTTFGEALALDEIRSAAGTLPVLRAGSWVYGTFSTWIGSPEKNRAWDLLCEAKEQFDRVMLHGNLSLAQRDAAGKLLANCEGSDWFWWLAEHNSAQSVKMFDELYRANLTKLYAALKLAAPDALRVPLGAGAGHAEAGGSMRRAS